MFVARIDRAGGLRRAFVMLITRIVRVFVVAGRCCVVYSVLILPRRPTSAVRRGLAQRGRFL